MKEPSVNSKTLFEFGEWLKNKYLISRIEKEDKVAIYPNVSYKSFRCNSLKAFIGKCQDHHSLYSNNRKPWYSREQAWLNFHWRGV